MRAFAVIALAALVGALTLLPASSMAQAPGLNPGRDCQTLVSCNYRKNGSFRGCISSYSCRYCKLVSVRCQINGGERTCREMRCGWG